jgi:hypothetical protein
MNSNKKLPRRTPSRPPISPPSSLTYDVVALIWTTEGADFSLIDFWGSFVGQCRTISSCKITMGGLSLSIRLNFAKKTDDCVLYFKFFDYIC